MIVCKINVTRIDKEHFFVTEKGKYLDIALHENKDGEDQYGNLGFITQSVSKEARERGEKGPIIGNWKEVGTKKPKQDTREYKMNSRPATKPAQTANDAALNPEDDDVPF